MSANIGTKFDDFIMLKVLERSKNYVFVAKVKSKLDGKFYAMKRIELNNIDSAKDRKYYENEYQITQKFNHENVSKAVSCFKEKNVIYIITEYIEGQNLKELYDWRYKNKDIIDTRIEESKLLKYIYQCLRGLEYIHKSGYIHRNIILDNIMKDDNDRIKILNFKRTIEQKNNDKEIIDKKRINAFTAPEMAKGGYDEKVDVYSLGIVFSFLAYFSRKKPKEEFYHHRLYDIIEKMKEKDEKKRKSSAQIFLEFRNNIYYEKIRACIKCLIFCFCINEQKNKLLTLEGRQRLPTSFTYKIIELSKLIKINEFNSEKSIQLIEKFRENIIKITKIKPNEFTEFLLYILDKEEIINRDENSITFEQKGKANEIRKEELYEKYKEYYDNNKSIISENFLVTLFSIEKCGNCQNEIGKFQSQYFLKFNKDDIENERGEIKNIFLNYNDNISNTKVKKCDACEQNKAMELSIQFYKLSKYLLIFIEHGFESSKIDMKNLDKLKIGKKEVISLDDGDEYIYKLVSFIAKEKGAYDYYNRKKSENEFTKNDEEKIENQESTYSLEKISGNIIALYYYCEELDNENNNINNLPPTNPTSVNGDNQSLNGQNISFTSNIIFGNFNNENPNINGIHFQNNVQVGFNNNLNNINISSDNNMNRNSHSQNQIPRISPHNNNNNDRNSSSSINVRTNNFFSDNNNRRDEPNPRK